MTINQDKGRKVLNMATGETIGTDGAFGFPSTWLWECLNCGTEQTIRIRGKGQYHRVCECGQDRLDVMVL